MKKTWHDKAWDDYLYWQEQDKKTLKRINTLLRDIERSPYDGVGEPEELKYDLSGCYSRRIDKANRIVYRIVDNVIEVVRCRGHYE